MKLNFFKTKDGKTVFTNILSLGFLQIAGYVFPLLTMPYLARVLGVSYIGKIAFASAIIIYFQTLVDYGFNFTATRDVAKRRDDIEAVSKIYSSVLYCKILLLILAFTILASLVAFVPKMQEEADILFATFLLLPGYIIFPEWLFQGLEKMKFITVLNILSKFIFTIAVFVFIQTKNDYLLQPLLTACGYVSAGIIAMWIIRYKLGVRLIPVRKCNLRQTLKGSTDVFLNQLVPNLYNSFSVMLLGFFCGPMANGIFEAGNRLISIADRLLIVVSRAFFPFLARNADKHNKYALWHFSLFFACALVLFLFSEYFIKFLFSTEFLDAVWVLRILALSLLGMGMANIYGTNYLIVTGKDKVMRNINFRNALFGFVLSFPLIYFYGYIGAALTICITRLCLGVKVFIKARQYQKA